MRHETRVIGNLGGGEQRLICGIAWSGLGDAGGVSRGRTFSSHSLWKSQHKTKCRLVRLEAARK